MAAESGHTDSNGILRSTDDTVLPFGMVLKTEHQSCQCLRIHIGQLVRPDTLDKVARGCTQSASVSYLERWFQRDGQCPAGGMTTHIRLVYPGTRQIQAGRNLARTLLQVRTAPGCQPFMGITFQHHIFHSSLLAHLALGVRTAVAVHHQYVRFHNVQRGQEIQYAVSGVDICILHITDALYHEQTFLLRIHRLVILVVQDGLVRTDTHIQIPILRCLAEKLHMPRVQQVITSAYKYFLFHLIFILLAVSC